MDPGRSSDELAYFARFHGTHGAFNLGDHIPFPEATQIPAILGRGRIVGILLRQLGKILAAFRLLVNRSGSGHHPCDVLFRGVLAELEKDVPGTGEFLLAKFGQIGLVVLPHFPFAHLDLGPHLLAHQPESFKLFLQLGLVLVKGKSLRSQCSYQGFLTKVVLLLHVLDGLLQLFFGYLYIQLSDLLLDQFLVDEPVERPCQRPRWEPFSPSLCP